MNKLNNWQAINTDVTAEQAIAASIQASLDTTITDGCELNPDDCYNCIAYDPASAIISYSPSDPFRAPNVVPEFYSKPAWKVITRKESNLDVGDVVTGIDVLPTIEGIIQAIVVSGFPRFKIKVEGSGILELQFVKIIAGGTAVITVDGRWDKSLFVNLSSLSGLNLSSALAIIEELTGVEIRGDYVETEIVEIPIEGEGEHEVLVQAWPNLGTSLSLFELIFESGFGFGFRKAEWCRNQAEIEQPPINCPRIEWRDGTAYLCQGVDCADCYPLYASVDGCDCEADVEDDPDDCCCESEGDMCSNCDGQVRYLNGEWQVRAGSQWLPLPSEALEDLGVGQSSVVPPPASQNPQPVNPCRKAHGLWEIHRQAISAAFDVLTDATTVLSLASAQSEYRRRYQSTLDPLQGALSNLVFEWWDEDTSEIQALEDDYLDNEVAIQEAFICEMLSLMSASPRATNQEIASARTYSFATGNSELDSLLTDAVAVPDGLVYGRSVAAFVDGVESSCDNCDGSGGVVNPDVPEAGCSVWGSNIPAGQYPPSAIIADNATITQIIALGSEGTQHAGLLRTTSQTFPEFNKQQGKAGVVYELIGDVASVNISAFSMSFRISSSNNANIQQFEAVIGFATGDSDVPETFSLTNFGGNVDLGTRVIENPIGWAGLTGITRIYVGFETNSNATSQEAIAELLSITIDYSSPNLPPQSWRADICP
jgi:hypothetical protein